jgi:farnesol dehydrogenase
LAHERVELVQGDVTDRDLLRAAMEGCSHVFHLAAYAKNWARDPKRYFEVNVQGTRNVLDMAERYGARRLVCTSSIATLGSTPPGQLGDEETTPAADRYPTEYAATKATAEKEAVQRAAAGLPVVIVNPTRVFGPGHLTEANSLTQLIDQYDRGRMPFLPNRGVNVGNYAFVEDVVRGHLAAMEKGRVAERYILGGENVTLKQFFRIIDQVSGKRHFQIPLLRFSPMLFAYVQQKRAEWFNVYPRITPGWVRTYFADAAFSCEKAERELDYRPTPLVEGIRITYEWLQRVRKERA